MRGVSEVCLLFSYTPLSNFNHSHFLARLPLEPVDHNLDLVHMPPVENLHGNCILSDHVTTSHSHEPPILQATRTDTNTSLARHVVLYDSSIVMLPINRNPAISSNYCQIASSLSKLPDLCTTSDLQVSLEAT